jgi:hypothetical protein
MLADLLTKALGSRKFIHFKAMLGIGGAARGDMEPGQVLCGERLDVPSEYEDVPSEYQDLPAGNI